MSTTPQTAQLTPGKPEQTQQSGSAGAGLLLRSILAQTRVELLLTIRRGESVLITIIVPVILLVFFASLNIVPAGTRPIDFLLPGMLALAVMATGMVSLGIATAYERYYGVLKRLGGSPLPRGGLIAAKILSVLVLEAIQAGLLIGVAAGVYGWRPQGSFRRHIARAGAGHSSIRSARPSDGWQIARRSHLGRRKRPLSALSLAWRWHSAAGPPPGPAGNAGKRPTRRCADQYAACLDDQ